MHQVKGILNGSLDLASSSFGLKYFSFEKCIDHLPLLSTKHRQRKEKGWRGVGRRGRLETNCTSFVEVCFPPKQPFFCSAASLSHLSCFSDTTVPPPSSLPLFIREHATSDFVGAGRPLSRTECCSHLPKFSDQKTKLKKMFFWIGIAWRASGSTRSNRTRINRS